MRMLFSAGFVALKGGLREVVNIVVVLSHQGSQGVYRVMSFLGGVCAHLKCSLRLKCRSYFTIILTWYGEIESKDTVVIRVNSIERRWVTLELSSEKKLC